jgi:hypothetical protein
MCVCLFILSTFTPYSFPEHVHLVSHMMVLGGGGAGAQGGCIAKIVNVAAAVTGVFFRGQRIDASSDWRGQIDPVAGGESDPVSM